VYVIKPGASLKKGQFLSSLAFLLWAGIGLAALLHYFRNVSSPYETIAIIASVIYGAGFRGLLGYAIHRALLGKNVGDAKLYTSTVKFQRGQSVKIEVQQAFKKNLLVVNAMVGIAVIEISRKGDGNKSRCVTRTVYEDWLPGVVNIQVPAKEVLSLSADVALPVHLMHSSRYNSRYPRYIWNFSYTLELANSPDFKTRYPIMLS
jgi:hypothetical protein